MSVVLETPASERLAPEAPAPGSPPPESLHSVDVLGVRCFSGTVDDAVARVIERSRSGLGGYAVLCNVHVLMTAHKRADLHRALDDAWAVLPDGAPVAWLQRRLGSPSAERAGGPDVMLGVLDRGRAVGLRHAYVGSTEATLQRLSERIERRFPGVDVVGTLSLPFGDPGEWSEAAIETVRSWRPDIVWLALGAPKQELWMQQYASALAPAVVLGVGAAFDFHAETKSRAPGWMQRAGLEWAHRLGAEPRRLLGRYLTTNTAFLMRVAPVLSRQARSHQGPGFPASSGR